MKVRSVSSFGQSAHSVNSESVTPRVQPHQLGEAVLVEVQPGRFAGLAQQRVALLVLLDAQTVPPGLSLSIVKRSVPARVSSRMPHS